MIVIIIFLVQLFVTYVSQLYYLRELYTFHRAIICIILLMKSFLIYIINNN